MLLCAAAGAAPDRLLGANVPRPAATGDPWSGAARTRLAGDLDSLLANAPALRGAHVGLLALDSARGDLLYARAPDDDFIPASTLKLITGSFALAALGPDYRFTTSAFLLRAGGTLVVRGGGDPLIDAGVLAQLAAAVRGAGITALPGGVRLDPGAFATDPYPPGWAWDDLAYAYAAPRSSLTFNENARNADEAQRDPAQAFAAALDDALAAAGVLVPRGALPGIAPGPPDRPLWTFAGEPLGDLLGDCWQPSDNFIAEQLLLAVGAAAQPPASGTPASLTDRALAAESAWLQTLGVDPGTVTLTDGSGLSGYDRLTPRALVTVLQADWNGPQRALTIDDLPLAGVRGTLATRFLGTAAAQRTFAKTGSMNHTRALAGYLATERHGAVTFALLIDDWLGDDANLDALRGAVLARIAGD